MQELVTEQRMASSVSASGPGPGSARIRVHFSPANIALLLLFCSACFHSLAYSFYFCYRLIFGTLYPSYASYKAIKNRDIKEYARWMMYWVCFGLFSFAEVFSDLIFGFWLPFYYEIKILLVFWLVSPYGNGARIMYKNIIHPELNRRELAIDSYISTAKAVGVTSLWHVWAKVSHCVNLAIFNFLQMAQAALIYNLQRQQQQQSSLVYNPFLLPIQSQPIQSSPRIVEADGDDHHSDEASLKPTEPMEVNGNEFANEAICLPDARSLFLGDEGKESEMEMEQVSSHAVDKERIRQKLVELKEDCARLENENEAKAKVRRRKLFELDPIESVSQYRRPPRTSAVVSRERCRVLCENKK